MLRVDLRAAGEGPVPTRGSVPQDDPALSDIGFALAQPVVVSGRLTDIGPGQWLWRGVLSTVAATGCRRCLTPLTPAVSADVNLLFTEDESADDPSAIQIPPGTPELDLVPAIREELILAAPEYVVCRDDCRGMCAQCGTDLNAGPCDCRPAPDSRWAALDALKSPADDELR